MEGITSSPSFVSNDCGSSDVMYVDFMWLLFLFKCMYLSGCMARLVNVHVKNKHAHALTRLD